MRSAIISFIFIFGILSGPVCSQEITVTALDDLLQKPATVALAPSQPVTVGQGGVLRVLDRLNGDVVDITLDHGQTETLGFLRITLHECRHPIDNPSGDAFAAVQVADISKNVSLFSGWLLASAPALHAMDHPRYDVWALRCITS